MLLYHNLSHNFNMAEEILTPNANHRGKALDWTFLEAFPTMELLMASCHESGFKKGRINDTAISTKRYFNCKISGCPKRLRSVTLLCEIAEEEEDFLHRFSLEDNSSVLHCGTEWVHSTTLLRPLFTYFLFRHSWDRK